MSDIGTQAADQPANADQFLDELVFAWAERQPQRLAVVYRDQDLTYGQLRNRVLALAAGLVLAGVKRGDFVATLLEPGLDISAALLAINRVGAIYAPLDPEHPDAQIGERLEALQPRLLLSQADLRERAEAWVTPARMVEQLLHEGAIARLPVDGSDRALDEPACIFFTSGTTGRAKGALGSFRAQRDAIVEPAAFLGLHSGDTLNSIARYAWSISMLELLAPLVVGGTSLILDRAAALNLDELYGFAQRCTAFHCPPALLKSFAEHVHSQGADPAQLAAIRLVWYGGDSFSLDAIRLLQRVFAGARVGTAYGCTEIFGLSHCYWYAREQMPGKVLIGRPVGGMGQLLLDQGQAPVAPGGEGEILLGGSRVALGYWQRPELNREKFVERDGQRYYLTGDYGRLSAEGELEFVERRDAQVKIRGIRIELGEVEHLLYASAPLKDAVVIVKDSEGGERELHAFVVFQNEAQANLAQLRAEFKARAPDYLVPAALHALPRMPLTENFKIDRKALAAYAPAAGAGAALDDPLCQRLAEVWRKAAHVQASAAGDNFFEVGGNSLTAALLAAMLSREFDRRVEVADVYSAPTLAAQAALFRAPGEPEVAPATDSGVLFAAQGQKGLVFRELFEKRDGSITCTRYIHCAAGFDGQLVRAALKQLIERYPSLNTRLKFDKRNLLLERGEPVTEAQLAVTRDPGQWSLDGRAAPVPGKRAHRFDLKREPLIAAVISALVEGGELLQLTAHHVAADDNSMGRLAADFIAIYDALRRGAQARLPLLVSTYEDFVRDQQARIASAYFDRAATEIGQKLLAHHQRFGGQPLLPAVDLAASRSIEHPLAVKHLAFADYVAALSWAMARTFGRRQFVFCAHVALQRDSDEDPRVGMFVNLLPLFIGVDAAHSPSQHAQRTQADFDSAMARSNVPYELILANTEALRRLGHFPFDAFINELHFNAHYPEGYTDVVVARNFATGGEEISLSVLHLADGELAKYESPGFGDDTRVLPALAAEVETFLAEIRPSAL